jgi:B12 binding domain
MFHRSWGILMIQQNISAPTTVLDLRTRESFEAELAAHDYDIVGISSIIVNVGKVAEMCRIVRRIAPRATIVVGGHRRGNSGNRRKDRRPRCARRWHFVDAALSG